MSTTPERQFVELRDLSPNGRLSAAYDRPDYNHEQTREDTHFIGDRSGSDETFHENDASSQSPIVSKDGKPSITRRKAWRENHQEVHVTRAGKIYRQVMEYSFVTRWLLFVVPVAIILAVPIIAGAFETGASLGGVRIVWVFLWIEIVWLGLWVAKFVAKILPRESNRNNAVHD